MQLPDVKNAIDDANPQTLPVGNPKIKPIGKSTTNLNNGQPSTGAQKKFNTPVVTPMSAPITDPAIHVPREAKTTGTHIVQTVL